MENNDKKFKAVPKPAMLSTADYFAGQALVGILASGSFDPMTVRITSIAEHAYEIGEKMAKFSDSAELEYADHQDRRDHE